MTDIVERLRSIDISWSDEGELAANAAVQIVGMRQEIASIKAQLDESKANDLFAMKLLAESQAREKVLRDALDEIGALNLADCRSALELQESMICTNDEALNASFKAGELTAAQHILSLFEEKPWVFARKLVAYVEELK